MKKSKLTGKFIISAGEVGAFSVCAESWRLRTFKPKPSTEASPSSRMGRRLHDEWVMNYEDSIALTKGSRILLSSLILAISLFILFETIW